MTQHTDRAIIRSFFGIDNNMDSKNQSISDDFDEDYGHFDTDEMDDTVQWEYGENYMITFVLLKFVFTILSLTCNVPAGIFTPVFTIGAVFG